MITSNDKRASEKILERIRALLAMGGDTSSEHEAAIALKRARKLMDDHQVTLADIENIKDDDLGSSEYDLGSTRQQRWVTRLAINVAKLNDCIVTYAARRRGENKRYQFKGFKEDAGMCEFMLVYLVDTCNRLYQRDKDKLGLYGTADKNDFLRGLAAGIIDRIKDMIEERNQAQASDGRSLVLIKMAVVEAEFGKEKYRNVKVRSAANHNAYSAGKRTASEVHLGSFVGSNSKPTVKLCG